MPTTTPDSIFYEDSATQYGDATNQALQSASVQTALNKRQIYTYLWANDAARTAQTGMRTGDVGYVQNNQTEWTYDGFAAAWVVSGTTPWKLYSPTYTGMTFGTGASVLASYRYVGNKVEVKLAVKFGAGMAVSSNPSFTLPVPAEGTFVPYLVYNGIGSAYIGSNISPLYILANNLSTTVAVIYALNSPGFSNVGPTVPGTWVNGSSFNLNISFVPA